jgi:hypothetical protein
VALGPANDRSGLAADAQDADDQHRGRGLRDQETRFFQALGSAARWTIDRDGLLLIYSAGADEPSRFAPFEQWPAHENALTVYAQPGCLERTLPMGAIVATVLL